MKIILDKIERISISIAILIFASGCFIQGGSFLLPAFFIAGMLGPSTMFDIGSSHACNIDGSPMCGSTDIHGNPYGVT